MKEFLIQMQKKIQKLKAFTLIELLAVIAILGVLSAIIYPSVVGVLNKSKEDAYHVQIKEIESAASKWAYKNASLLPTENDDTITIYLGDLKRAGLIDQDLTNPITTIKFPNDMEILIKRKGTKYQYVVNDKSGTDTGDVALGIGTIVLRGLPYEYAEVGTTYTDPGAIAISKNGSSVPESSIVKTIKLNGTKVSAIDMKSLKKYEITYAFTEDGKTIQVKRNVEVRDTTPPVLTVPTNTNLSVTASSFGVKDNVKAVDNYDGDITNKVEAQGNVTLHVPGVYVITYTVSDSSGNKRSKKRTITVSGDICTLVKITGSTKEGTYTNKDVTLTAATANGNIPEATTYQWQKVVNGVWVDIAGATGRTYTEKAETSTRYRVKYKQFQCDSASNEYAVSIDKTPPTCTLSTSGTAGNNGWYKSNATVTLASKEDTGGSSILSYGINNSSTAILDNNTSKTQANTSSTGQTWYGFVKDKAGNVGTCSKLVKVDTTPPTCTSTGGNADWTSGYRTLVGTCSDSISGCATPSVSTGTKYSTATYNAFNSTTESPGTVTDNAGNSTVCPGNQTVRIDRIPPTCASSGGSTDWTKGSRTLVGTCTDTLSKCQGNVSKLYDYETNVSSQSPGTVYDNVGNSTICPNNQTVRIDRTGPSCTSRGGNAAWTKGSRTIYGDCNDNGGSGCSQATISKDFTTEMNTTTASPGTVTDILGNSTVCPGNQTVRIDKRVYTPTVTGISGSCAYATSWSCTETTGKTYNDVSCTINAPADLCWGFDNTVYDDGSGFAKLENWYQGYGNANGGTCSRPSGNAWSTWATTDGIYRMSNCTYAIFQTRNTDQVGNVSKALNIRINYKYSW